jgi:hypothetical protein
MDFLSLGICAEEKIKIIKKKEKHRGVKIKTR